MLRFFGIVAFALMLVVAAYTLRRRFVRKLPWKVQDWLWLHVWFGILSLLLSLHFLIPLACLALTVIGFHSVAELANMLLPLLHVSR